MHKILLYLFLSCATIVLVYYPGLSGGFVLDDISNILHPLGIRMDVLSWESLKNSALSMDKRPLARASFGLNYLSTGFNPFYFKATNIAIHCVNSLLVFGFVFLLLKHQNQARKSSEYTSRLIFIAVATSVAWAIHPVNLTNVLYSVQRMNSLSALFVLAGMLCYMKGRVMLGAAPGKAWLLIISSLIIFLPMAWFSKENGALLPLFLFILELTLFQFASPQKRNRYGLYLFYILFLLLPSVIVLIYIIEHADMFHAAYENRRHFDMIERLLTEPRVLWLYIQMILLPSPSLFGLFHDDISVSTSITEPITTIFAIIGLTGLLVLALAVVKRLPVLSFGLLFFLTGHLLESSFIPLELAFEHRNYLPSIGLLLPLFYYLGYGFAPDKYMRTRLAVITVFILLLALQTHLRAWTWSDNIRLYLTEVQYHPQSARANYEAGRVFGQRLERGQGDTEINYRTALEHFNRVTSLRENTTSGLFGSILASIDGDKKIQPVWIKELEHRLGSQPLEQVNLLWLDRLTDCVSQAECRKEDVLIPRLLYSAIHNQYANSTNKAMLYSIQAKYAYQVEGDKDKTLIMARKAVSLIPSNLYYHLNLVKYLIWAGSLIEAKNSLKTAKKIDTNNQHTAEIATLAGILNTNLN